MWSASGRPIKHSFPIRFARTLYGQGCGAVNYPDTVLPYRHNLTIEDAIMMAGGLRESASSINVEVARRVKDPSSNQNVNRIADV